MESKPHIVIKLLFLFVKLLFQRYRMRIRGRREMFGDQERTTVSAIYAGTHL